MAQDWQVLEVCFAGFPRCRSISFHCWNRWASFRSFAVVAVVGLDFLGKLQVWESPDRRSLSSASTWGFYCFQLSRCEATTIHRHSLSMTLSSQDLLSSLTTLLQVAVTPCPRVVAWSLVTTSMMTTTRDQRLSQPNGPAVCDFLASVMFCSFFRNGTWKLSLFDCKFQRRNKKGRH